ncbi:MAG: ribonuclease H-like domain-containing protein [Anaerolineales bacterium]|jgi:uncharacterized protein
MPSLSDRLKSLGVQVGAQDLPPARQPRTTRIDQVVPGRLHQTSNGETYIVEKIYPAEYEYGRTGLLAKGALDPLLQWANPTTMPSGQAGSFAYLDIETTGLMGGAGTYAFLVGVGRFETDGFHLAQFFMRDPAEEPAHLLALEEFLAPCQMLVTYNGKSFDAPLLNTRYLAQGWKSPLKSLDHLDLLHLARRFWRERLPSRTLGNIETFILGARRSQEDVPGWMIPQLYFDYLRSGDAAPLQSVFYHNEMDVLAMAALLNHLTQMLENPPIKTEQAAQELAGMGRFYEDLGNLAEAIHAYQSCLACGVMDKLYWDSLQRLAYIYKRQGDFGAALALWEQAAQSNHLYAHVELAKYYEHRWRDYARALTWTDRALKILSRSDIPRYSQAEWQAGLEHRQARLKKKLDAGS